MNLTQKLFILFWFCRNAEAKLVTKVVRKCCPLSQILDLETFACTESQYQSGNVTILPENMLNISRETQEAISYDRFNMTDQGLIS